MRWTKSLEVFWPVAGLALSLALWQLLSAILGPFRLPSPGSLWPDVVVDLHTNALLEIQGLGSQGIWPHLLYTMQETLLGATVGILLGVSVGLGMARWKTFMLLTEEPTLLLRSLPPLAAIPFALLWFGPTRAAQFAIVVYFAAGMMIVTTRNAVSNVDPLYRRFAQTLGASENRVFRTVVLPAILPEMTGGIRVAVGLAWGTEIISELAGAPMGMGQVFSRMVAYEALNVIIIGIIWVTVSATLVDLLIVAATRYLTRWLP